MSIFIIMQLFVFMIDIKAEVIKDPCLSNGSTCATNADCCSNDCDFTENLWRTCNPKIKSPPTNIDTTIDGPKICKSLLKPCMIDDDCCSKNCVEFSLGASWAQLCIGVKSVIIDDLESTTIMTTQKKNNIGCTPNGSNCFAHYDCCSKRCYNYPGTTYRRCF